jgi:predicted porin
MAQSVKVNDKSTTDTDRKLTGFGADYKLSKTSRLYARYDAINFASNLTSFNGSQQKRYA